MDTIDTAASVREATLGDITRLHEIRMSVKENALSNPGLVTPGDYEEFLTRRGKGWVSEMNGVITGFAIVDLVDHNVWALFLDRAYEGKGMGRQLHDTMMNWYFEQTSEPIWLSTAPGTRADIFYRKAGWTQTGWQTNGEVRFEMTAEEWKAEKH